MKAKVLGCQNVGFMDMNGSKTKCGWLWRNMIARCYGKNTLKRNPSYQDCYVCDEWLVYSNFKRWFDENYIEGYELDKDIFIKGNKIYSPDTCCFVPHFINSIFTKTNASRGILPIGVKSMGKRYQARLLRYDKSTHLGTYDTPEEAFNAYKQAKESYIKEVATTYYNEGRITKRVYDALMKYEVEITD